MSVKNVFRKDIPIQVEPNEPQGLVVPSPSAREDEQLPDTIPVGQPLGSNQPECSSEDASKWDDSLAPAVPQAVDEIDMNKLRDLLFSIRDNQIYCPLCRCPEWSSQYPDMRTSHYEGCNLGETCEQLLKLYPKDGATVKWRK